MADENTKGRAWVGGASVAGPAPGPNDAADSHKRPTAGRPIGFDPDCPPGYVYSYADDACHLAQSIAGVGDKRPTAGPFQESAVNQFQESGSPCDRGYDYDPVQQRCVASTGLKVTLPATAPGPNMAPTPQGAPPPIQRAALQMTPPLESREAWRQGFKELPGGPSPARTPPSSTNAPRPAAAVAPQGAPPPIQRAASNTTPHPLASHPMMQMMRPGWRPPGIR